MKTTIVLTLSLLALLPAKALAGSSTLNGALIGGIAGAVIGANSGDRHDALAGAAIGATAGALIGASVDDSHRHRGSYGRSHVSVSYGIGYGYRPYYHRGYRHYGHYGWGYPAFYYSYSRPLYYSSDYEDDRPVRVVTAPEAQPAATPAQPAQNTPQNVTIINNYYGGASPMTSANGLFGR